MTRIVTLGDSITLGMGDPAPGGGWRGFAEHLSTGLTTPELHNLAQIGAQARHVERDQLPVALELRPEIATVIVGINDTLRAGFQPDRTGQAIERTVAALREAGATVLTMRLPDPARMFGLPDVLARPLSRRMMAVNAQVDHIAARYGTLHWNAAGDPATYDRLNWSVDRLHPNERGHRLVACRFWDMLDATGHALAGSPSPEPTSPPPTRQEKIQWMATRGTLWFMRRSVDLIPYMLFMAARDWLADSASPALLPRPTGPGRPPGLPRSASREWLPQTDLEMISAADDPEPVAD
ncbi:MAG TPA: SGNH/GDSL hydrolase family protein [Trebonia sp.]|jgi:lysophospholipase L1-like esterase|nr:SGNH/GDSL hydrolase family protein [Trebonia sp.]